MTITRLTAEHAQRREREMRQFKEIERKIEARPKVTMGRDPRARMEIKRHVVEKFIKPKDISPAALKKKQILMRKWEKKDLPKWVTDFMGDPLKLSGRERKLVLPFYGKSSEDALKQKSAMTSYLNYVSKEVKKNPAKAVLFAALPPAFKIAGRGIRATGITRLITQIPHGETISKRSLQLVSAGVGAVYSKDIHNRVTEPIFTVYKDGKSTTSQRTLPNGDIEITTTTKQNPQYRKPTGPEQHERIGGIFATELAPLAISHRLINRGVKTGYKKPPKPKTKVKVTTIIKRAGKVIKITRGKIKALPKIIKPKEKATVLKVTKKGELKLLETKRSKLLKEQAKAKGKERKEIQKRLKKVESAISKQKVTVLKVTKKGELKLLETKRSKLLKEQAKTKGKERKEIQKRLKKVEKELAFKEAFKPKKKVVQLSNSAYANITKLSKLKVKIKALIAKIRAISATVAKRMGLNKSKETKRLTVLLRETNVVKSYDVMVKMGVPKTTVVEKLQKLPENKLQVLDTKTGKIIKDIEKTVDDIELRVIKPSKKPPVEYKEVKVGKEMVQLQKVVTKQEIKTVVLAKTELKALQKLNTEAKSIVKTKPKTAITRRTKQKQLTKVNTKIKSKRKQLIQLRFKLRSNNTKLKQKQRQLTILIRKQKEAEKAKTKEIITAINGRIIINDHVIGSITKTIVIPVPKEIITPIPRPTPIPKPKIEIVPIPMIIPVSVPTKRKIKPKKKKKMTQSQYRDWYIKNEIPTLKSLYG